MRGPTTRSSKPTEATREALRTIPPLRLLKKTWPSHLWITPREECPLTISTTTTPKTRSRSQTCTSTWATCPSTLGWTPSTAKTSTGWWSSCSPLLNSRRMTHVILSQWSDCLSKPSGATQTWTMWMCLLTWWVTWLTILWNTWPTTRSRCSSGIRVSWRRSFSGSPMNTSL